MSQDDRERQWHRVHIERHIGLAGAAWHRVALHRAWQTDAEWICRELQRSPARRVPERTPVCQPQRGPADHRELENRLPHQSTAHEPQRPHTDRVCQALQQGRKPEQSLLINEGNQGSRSQLALNNRNVDIRVGRNRFGIRWIIPSVWLSWTFVESLTCKKDSDSSSVSLRLRLPGCTT